MRRVALALAILTGSAAAAPKKHTQAKKAATKNHANARFSNVSDADATPAVKYAAMSADECEAELGNRNIGFTKEEHRGVFDPIRLTGTLHGVEFRTDQSDLKREDSPYEVLDCRLALALDDFSKILAAHDIVQVRHYSMYRPPPKSWADARIGAQHNGALAIDAGRFTKKDGSTLDVLKDFHGRIGDKTCGDGAGPRKPDANSKELRDILCTAVDQHLFNVVLTPDFNRPHRNHFHLEVMANVKWFLVH